LHNYHFLSETENGLLQGKDMQEILASNVFSEARVYSLFCPTGELLKSNLANNFTST